MKNIFLLFSILLVSLISLGQNTNEDYYNSLMVPIQNEYKTVDFDSISQVIVDKINEFRIKNGLNVLSVDTSLTSYSEKWSEVCLNGVTKHSDIGKYNLLAENLHYASALNPWIIGESLFYNIPEEVFKGWFNSEGHKLNMLTKNAKTIGVGLATYMDGKRYKMVCVMVLK